VSASARYGAASVTLVALVTLALWPFLDPTGRQGVLVAAGIALPMQIAAFAMLVRFRGRLKGFMAAWAGGMALRLVTVVGVAFWAIRTGSGGVVPMLLSLAGFFFALLVIEPLFFRTEQAEAV